MTNTPSSVVYHNTPVTTFTQIYMSVVVKVLYLDWLTHNHTQSHTCTLMHTHTHTFACLLTHTHTHSHTHTHTLCVTMLKVSVHTLVCLHSTLAQPSYCFCLPFNSAVFAFQQCCVCFSIVQCLLFNHAVFGFQ